MKTASVSQDRRDFLKKSMSALAMLAIPSALYSFASGQDKTNSIVSIVRISNERIDLAVEKAIDLLGGISTVTTGKNRIMLKPNLVSDDPNCTTKPAVIRTLAKMMQGAGKEVLIGEGSAAASGINADAKGIYFTRKPELLDKLQQQVFDKLGYTDLAKELGISLVNLHTGPMADVLVPGAHYYKKLTLHKSLTDIDLLCSVPMMKTHVLATVTLGLKNVIGLYPGSAYCSVRSCVHTEAEQGGSPGIAYEILDMVKANKMGLTVIDGSTSMEGEGPSNGKLVKTDLIIASTNPLAADMVAAATMGFEPREIPVFSVAHTSGMHPLTLDEIEIRGEPVENVKRVFARATVFPWHNIQNWFGAKEV
jgi:uncharacterized protein (DUF362 family)